MPTTTRTKDLIANFIVSSSAYGDIDVSVFPDEFCIEQGGDEMWFAQGDAKFLRETIDEIANGTTIGIVMFERQNLYIKLVNFGNSLLIESENKNYSVMLDSNIIDEFCNDIRNYIG